MAVPEYTIADFIHRDSWWKNRGTSLAICIEANNLLTMLVPRPPDFKYLFDITTTIIGTEWP
jgi:hypothetical protein